MDGFTWMLLTCPESDVAAYVAACVAEVCGGVFGHEASLSFASRE